MTAHSSLDYILGHRPWDSAPSGRERPVQPVAPLEKLVLTRQLGYIDLEGGISLPAEYFDSSKSLFARNGIDQKQAATEGYCVADMALAELELTGRPVVLTFKDKEFDVEAMPWLLWKLWQLCQLAQKR